MLLVYFGLVWAFLLTFLLIPFLPSVQAFGFQRGPFRLEVRPRSCHQAAATLRGRVPAQVVLPAALLHGARTPAIRGERSRAPAPASHLVP